MSMQLPNVMSKPRFGETVAWNVLAFFLSVTNKITKSNVATRIYVKYPLSSSCLSGVGSYWPKFVLWHLCRPVSAVIFCAICVPSVSAFIFCAICVAQSALLSFAQFVFPSQRCYFYAICIAQSGLSSFAQFVSLQSAPFSFAQFVSPSQRCSLLRNLCPPVIALLFCAMCVAQSAMLSFAQFVSPQSALLSFA
jgi:hypothetical protein